MQLKKNREARVKIPLQIATGDRDALEDAAKELGLLSATALLRMIVREFVANRKANAKAVANG